MVELLFGVGSRGGRVVVGELNQRSTPSMEMRRHGPFFKSNLRQRVLQFYRNHPIEREMSLSFANPSFHIEQLLHSYSYTVPTWQL